MLGRVSPRPYEQGPEIIQIHTSFAYINDKLLICHDLNALIIS